MTSAGDSVRDVPLVGDQIAAPFREVSGAGTTIEQAGTDLVDAVTKLANILGWVTALVPIIIVGLVWLCCGDASCAGPAPHSGSSTTRPTSTSSPSGRWPGSRCASRRDLLGPHWRLAAW